MKQQRWKPTMDETYSFISTVNRKLIVRTRGWENSELDKSAYRNKNCFRTQKEAQQVINAILKG